MFGTFLPASFCRFRVFAVVAGKEKAQAAGGVMGSGSKELGLTINVNPKSRKLADE